MLQRVAINVSHWTSLDTTDHGLLSLNKGTSLTSCCTKIIHIWGLYLTNISWLPTLHVYDQLPHSGQNWTMVSLR